jgi:hypothetical protein
MGQLDGELRCCLQQRSGWHQLDFGALPQASGKQRFAFVEILPATSM